MSHDWIDHFTCDRCGIRAGLTAATTPAPLGYADGYADGYNDGHSAATQRFLATHAPLESRYAITKRGWTGPAPAPLDVTDCDCTPGFPHKAQVAATPAPLDDNTVTINLRRWVESLIAHADDKDGMVWVTKAEIVSVLALATPAPPFVHPRLGVANAADPSASLPPLAATPAPLDEGVDGVDCDWDERGKCRCRTATLAPLKAGIGGVVEESHMEGDVRVIDKVRLMEVSVVADPPHRDWTAAAAPLDGCFSTTILDAFGLGQTFWRCDREAKHDGQHHSRKSDGSECYWPARLAALTDSAQADEP